MFNQNIRLVSKKLSCYKGFYIRPLCLLYIYSTGYVLYIYRIDNEIG